MSTPKPKAQQGVLLFEDDDAEGTTTSDPQLEQKISKYLEERVSLKTETKRNKKGSPSDPDNADEHTGITDDDDEGEPDYDVASRMTLKASSEAFLEVMAEARKEHEREKEAERKKTSAAGGKAALSKEAQKKS